MKDLNEKYGGFVSPCFGVKINGKDLGQTYCQGDVRIELTSSYDASGCVFQIPNGFSPADEKTLKVKDEIHKLLKLGNKVEVAIGYRTGGIQTVFMGYIDALYVDYDKDEGILYTVECLDGKGIMMNSFRSESKVSMKKNSEVVENMIKKYSSLIQIESGKLDKSDKERNMPIEQHNESDYDFVVRLAKQMNYCFFIENGTLVFQPFSKLSKEPFFQFNMNQYLLGFKMMASLKDQVSSVTVRGNNEKDPTQPFESKVEKSKREGDRSGSFSKPNSVITKNVSKTRIDLTVDSVERATQIAQSELDQLSSQLYQGRVKVLGVPDMMPGRVVSVVGFGEELDKKYFVSKVIHCIKNSRFTTECELEVNIK